MMPLPGEAPPQASSALSPEEAADRFFERLPASCRLLVAFSGGGDSTGLLAVLSAARGARPGIILHSATVDHGLRSGSDAEARAASLVSRKLGVPHVTLQWTGEKPLTGIQASAREARYRLLTAEADRVRADFIVTGHTSEDQGETLFMRRARNAGTGEGMDEAVLVERRAWVVRPFLHVGREAIREYLRKRRLTWSEDPSNDNPAFERIRVRRSGAVPSLPSGEDRPNPYVVSAQFVRDSIKLHPGSVVAVDLRDCHPRYGPHWSAISTLAAILGGREHGPGTDMAIAIVERLASSSDFRLTANRVLFDRRKSTLYLCREDRGLPELVIAPGTSGHWDGRYEIVNEGSSQVTVGAGRAKITSPPLVAVDLDKALPKGLANSATASMPRIIDGDAAKLKVRMVLAPFEKFLPVRKLDLANSLATAFELEQFPLLSLGNGAF